ncbi:putative protein kinase-like protein [Trypanosoma rangeli]|uniref:Uncharacterized protein n=1 Tax=Trypanosoma rangeli TaxID=5698 RepID=A0A3R7M6X5_TRYRA|nr:putative protein kinase-like protein [Trypanosoma rangeli]RNF10166.1 putative protein kinase-like protein [Trypanosoma rangeli]|eukprot:RNF10166.1 putative protein kinase-like protein [Trypanosoma rangeli]
MDISVVLAADVLPSSDMRNTLILVGQRSVAGSGERREQTRCIVFDVIPCADIDVVVEQVECLEQVLPCGIGVLGVLLSGDGAKELVGLRRSIKNHAHVSALFAVTCSKGGKVQCQLLQSGKTLAVILLETRPVFVTMACYFNCPLNLFPFIVRSGAADAKHSVVVDSTSTTVLEHNDIWTVVDNLYAVQLGKKEGQREDMLCVHVTFAPLFSCGRDVYSAICSLLPKVAQRPEGVVVQVESQRHPALLYQWIFTPTERGAATLSMEQWNELRELIEDGVGEEVQSSQVVKDAFLGLQPAPIEAAKMRGTDTAKKPEETLLAEEFAQLERERSQWLRYIPPTLVVCYTIFWVFFW